MTFLAFTGFAMLFGHYLQIPLQGLRFILGVLNLNFNAFVYLIVAFYSLLITSERLALDLMDLGFSPSFYSNFQKRRTKM